MSRRTALAAGIVLALCFPHQALAQGGFNGTGRYQITNVKSGKVLDLDRSDQTSVVQFSSRGTDNQIWEIRETGGGFYSLRNGMNGNALEAVGTSNSTPVRATRFDGRAGQQWRFIAANGGSALILSRLGKVLDIPDGSTRDGVAIQTYDSNGDSNQQFQFRRLAGNVPFRYPASNNAGSVVSNAGSVASYAGTGRTSLKPGWNMFSAEQDVELGQQAANEVSQQVLMLNDSRVDNYLNKLGQRLVANAPGFKFPYTFQTVNDRGINAFALPGGHIYINRGVIEAADTESQLAGVMAHEAAHVALRHGTNQASKASAAQMPLAILGGLLGSNSTGAALAQLGAGFTVNSILLKYSRDAERQADLMGTQILFDSGLDPRGMGQFFQKIEGSNGIAFFSDHPNPDRRIDSVNEEVARLGSKRITGGTQEFAQIKRYVQSLPAPRPNQLQSQSQSQTQTQQQQNTSNQRDATSQRSVTFENAMLRINHPDNWQAYGQGDAVTIAPRGGMVSDSNGNQALAYGVVVNLYEPHWDQNTGQQLQGGGYGQGASSQMTPEAATNQLILALQQSNRNMRVVRRQGTVNMSGERGLSTFLSNDSPVQNGGRETNWLVTLPKQEGLLFFVFTAPEREFQSYENVFQQMLYSVRFKQQ
ncbi:MAG: M48 family metalloprotease [Bryobacteraceae bacterium]|nr:M48 family metalloprotease [Bryobacteraceae bacterium]